MLAEVKSRVSWSELQELAAQHKDAKKAYYDHKQPPPVLSIDDKIRWDLHETELHAAYCKIEIAYHAALKKYQEQTK